MKKIYSLLFLVLCVFSANAQGVWTQKANFGGTARASAVGFSIGTKGYAGTGYDGVLKNDFWEWDQATNTWTQKANLPGPARGNAVGFSIGNKGYIGTGGFSSSPLNDFWEWDQATNIWTQKSNFPGVARITAVGFSIGTKGYIGIGWRNPPSTFFVDFYEWDQATDTWTPKANFLGTPRLEASGFSIGTKGYIGTGKDATSIYLNDFWEWNQSTDMWTQKANFGGIGRVGVEATAFVISLKGYMGTGGALPSYSSDFFEYDPVGDTWTPKANYLGGGRIDGFGFSIGTKGYLGTGTNGTYKQDFWEYDPNGTVGENEFSQNSISIYPNPTTGKIFITEKNVNVEVYNINGEKVFLGTGKEIDLSAQTKGIYFVRLTAEGKSYSQKVVIK